VLARTLTERVEGPHFLFFCTSTVYERPTGITYVTEEHFSFVKLERTLTYLALGILGGGAAMGVGEGWYGPGPVPSHERGG